MSESAPIAFQEIEGKRISVTAKFFEKSGLVGIQIDEYEPNYPLIIDPTYSWHPFFASMPENYGYAITKDASGNIYVLGNSSTAWDGPGDTPPLNAYVGGEKIVVIKLNSIGIYQWHTYYGSFNDDYSRAIINDGSGIYVVGGSWAAWNGPGTQAPLYTHSGNGDILVLKLDYAGTYQWHTFYGSDQWDIGLAATFDRGGIYVTGQGNGSWNGPGNIAPRNPFAGTVNIPVLKLNSSGVYQWHTFYGSNYDCGHGITSDGNAIYITATSNATWNGPGSIAPLNAHTSIYDDIVIIKLNNSGTYPWHTFYGSSASDDKGYAITSDGSGVYIIGYSMATWNGPGSKAPLGPYASGWDIVIIKLNANGAYQWHTFYGSPGDDFAPENKYGHSISKVGNEIYIAGFSPSSWNGPGNGAPLNSYTNGDDIVVIKLNSTGTYQWHTFYGSANNDDSAAILSDGGDIYVAGTSGNWNGPDGTQPLNSFIGGRDILLMKLNTAGMYQWHTFYGSSSNDYGSAIAKDEDGNLYVVGSSQSPWVGPGGIAPLNAYTDGWDIVIVKLDSSGTYQWHTFFCSNADEYGNAITFYENNIYIGGEGWGHWEQSFTPLNAYKGGGDMIALMLNSAGTYQWHSFFGSYGYDSGAAITSNASGVFLAGRSAIT